METHLQLKLKLNYLKLLETYTHSSHHPLYTTHGETVKKSEHGIMLEYNPTSLPTTGGTHVQAVLCGGKYSLVVQFCTIYRFANLTFSQIWTVVLIEVNEG